MDRCAVFVDAGYLYAAGGTVCLGVKARARLSLDIAGVVGMLSDRATATCSQTLLRTYWYDGARLGAPSDEHKQAGLVPDVKVRLGRVNSKGQQKGVDALIYRDLMTLARERAISHAFLFAGDGDLVEGVRAAQDMGAHVTLMHITGGGEQGTSPDLLHEVDRRIEFGRADLEPYFTTAPTQIGPTFAAPTTPFVETVAITTTGPDSPDLQPAPVVTVSLDRTVTTAAARGFAQEWVRQALEHDVQALIEQHPRIPPHVDGALLRAVEAAHGTSLRGHESERHATRAGFWEGLTVAVATP